MSQQTTMRPALLLACCVSAALAACADRSTATMGAGAATCHAAGAQSLLGQRLDEHVLQEALRASGGLRSRVLQPGAQPAANADPMRLNIELDGEGRIHRMVCG